MAAAYRLARSQQAASVHVLNNELAHAHLRVGDLHHFLHRFLSQWTYVSLFSAVHRASQIGSSVLHTLSCVPDRHTDHATCDIRSKGPPYAPTSASDAAQTRIGGERSGLLNTLSYRP